MDRGQPVRGRRRALDHACSTRSWRTSRPRCSRWSRRGCASASSQAVLAEGGQEWPVDAPARRDGRRRDRGGRVVVPRGCGSATSATPSWSSSSSRGDGRAREERRPHGEERHRLRPPPAGDRLARHARRDRAGRAEAPAAAPGPPDAHGSRATASSSAAACSRRGAGSPSAVIAEPGRVDASGSRAGPTRSRSRRRPRDASPPRSPSTTIRRRSTRSAIERARRRRGGGAAVADRRRWSPAATTGPRSLGVGLVWFGLDGRRPDALDALRERVGDGRRHRAGHPGVRRPRRRGRSPRRTSIAG